jgi:hypothetical protein
LAGTKGHGPDPIDQPAFVLDRGYADFREFRTYTKSAEVLADVLVDAADYRPACQALRLAAPSYGPEVWQQPHQAEDEAHAVCSSLIVPRPATEMVERRDGPGLLYAPALTAIAAWHPLGGLGERADPV